MKTVLLTRAFQNPDVTMGMMQILGIDHEPIFTLELPWKENKPNISCIPSGKYEVVKHNSAKYPNVWRLENVKGRTGILIHQGNTTDDIQGCILVGLGAGTISGQDAVMKSLDAVKYLRNILPDKFTLVIQ